MCKSDCVMATVRKAVTKIRCCGEFGAESNTTPQPDVCVKALSSDRRVGILENLRFLVCSLPFMSRILSAVRPEGRASLLDRTCLLSHNLALE